MSFSSNWNVDKYKNDYESDDHWSLRREFMLAHKDKFPEPQLVCLTQVFFNMEFLGCRYPEKTMNLVNKLAAEVARDFREGRKGKLKRTFVGAQDAAGAKAKQIRSTATDFNESLSLKHDVAALSQKKHVYSAGNLEIFKKELKLKEEKFDPMHHLHGNKMSRYEHDSSCKFSSGSLTSIDKETSSLTRAGKNLLNNASFTDPSSPLNSQKSVSSFRKVESWFDFPFKIKTDEQQDTDETDQMDEFDVIKTKFDFTRPVNCENPLSNVIKTKLDLTPLENYENPHTNLASQPSCPTNESKGMQFPDSSPGVTNVFPNSIDDFPQIDAREISKIEPDTKSGAFCQSTQLYHKTDYFKLTSISQLTASKFRKQNLEFSSEATYIAGNVIVEGKDEVVNRATNLSISLSDNATEKKIRPKMTSAQRRAATKAKVEARGEVWDPSKYKKKRKQNKNHEAHGSEIGSSSDKAGFTDRPKGESLNPASEEPKLKATSSLSDVVNIQPSTSKQNKASNKVTGSIKVAIALDRFPEVKLTEEESAIIEDAVMEELQPLDDEGNFPSFTGSYLENGALILSCHDEATKNWVFDLMQKIKPLGEDKKLVTNLKNKLFQKSNRIFFRSHAKLNNKPPEMIIQMLKSQNPSFNVNEWNILPAKSDPKGYGFICYLNKACFKEVEAANFVVNLGLWQTIALAATKDYAKSHSDKHKLK